MLLHPVQVSELYPIGSVVESYVPPGDDWVLCDGQQLAQADYPVLFNLMDDPHPIFQDWETLDGGSGFGYETYKSIQGNSLFIRGGAGKIHYSSDGVSSWTEVNLTSSRSIYGLAYDGTTFVAVPSNTSPATDYYTSTDGMSWTDRVFPASIEGRRVCHDGTNFYVVSYDDGVTLYSANGTSWSSGGALPDTTWFSLAASPDVVVTMSYGGKLAVSTDSIATWKLYNAPLGSTREIYYDSTDDIFVQAFGSDPMYAVSAGDDGVEWDVRHLMVPEHGGSERSYSYSRPEWNRIKKVGSYWFAIGWHGERVAYSTDLQTWNAFPCIYTEWYDIEYNATTGYYLMYGYGNYFMRWKEVNRYDTATYFMLPKANTQHDWHSQTKKLKYIRVK